MPKSAAEKLGHKKGSIRVLGDVPASVADLLGAPTSGIGTSTDTVVLFADSFDTLSSLLPQAVAATTPPGRTWIAYRKGRKPTAGIPVLHRDTLQDALHAAAFDGVTLVALDGEWSALRVKPLLPTE
jgi:hypothetical protein